MDDSSSANTPSSNPTTTRRRRRKKTPIATETELLTKCRRRCCLCYFWNNDVEIKNGQIAHLDHDPANTSLDNLAYLCFEHHDQFDSKHIQAKNISSAEVTHAQQLLHHAINSRLAVTIELPIAFESFDDQAQDQFLELLKTAIDASAEVRVIAKRQGSVLVTLDLSPLDGFRLVDFVRTGQLTKIGDTAISRISVEPFGPTFLPSQLAHLQPKTDEQLLEDLRQLSADIKRLTHVDESEQNELDEIVESIQEIADTAKDLRRDD